MEFLDNKPFKCIKIKASKLSSQSSSKSVIDLLSL